MEFEVLLNFEDVVNSYKSRQHGIKALSRHSYWFPMVASPSLAGIIADLIGDGHVQDTPVRMRLDYTSKSTKELDRFGAEVYNIFKIRGKIRKCTTNTYGTMNYGVNCRPLIRVLRLLGAPSGSKVLTRFPIPEWILGNKCLFARFVNRLFSCEGSVDLVNKYIEIQMYKSETLIEDGLLFFKKIKSYLNIYFNIKTTEPFLGNTFNLRHDGIRTRPIRLKIKNKESLIKFRDFIGIEDPSKMVRLKNITENNLNKTLILT